MIEIHASGTPLEWTVTVLVITIVASFARGFFGAMGRDLTRIEKRREPEAEWMARRERAWRDAGSPKPR